MAAHCAGSSRRRAPPRGLGGPSIRAGCGLRHRRSGISPLAVPGQRPVWTHVGVHRDRIRRGEPCRTPRDATFTTGTGYARAGVRHRSRSRRRGCPARPPRRAGPRLRTILHEPGRRAHGRRAGRAFRRPVAPHATRGARAPLAKTRGAGPHHPRCSGDSHARGSGHGGHRFRGPRGAGHADPERQPRVRPALQGTARRGGHRGRTRAQPRFHRTAYALETAART